MQKYKILIVGGYTFCGDNATSITMRNLLDFIEKDSVAFLMTSYSNSPTGYRYCNIYPRYFANVSKSPLVKKLGENRSMVHGSIGTIENKSFKRKVYNYLHTVGSSYRMLLPFDYTDEVDKFIKDFQPDIIYSLLGSPAIVSLCRKISLKFHIPFVPHFMDDWPHVMYSNQLVLYPAKYILKNRLKRLLLCSPFGLTISCKMAREYQQEFNLRFYPFMNCIDNDWASESFTTISSDQKVKILYAGGLHLNRVSSIIFLCRVLEQISEYSFEVNIYTSLENWSKYKKELEVFNFVKYKGFVSQNEMMRIIEETGILLHVESFDNNIRKYTRLSISTKIPEYLSANKLIIAIGPKDIASIEYLKENCAAIVISSLDISAVKAKLLEYLSSEDKINELRTHSRRLFEMKHKKKDQILLIDKLFTQCKSI